MSEQDSGHDQAPDELDRLLVSWSDKRAADDDRLQQLESRIATAFESEPIETLAMQRKRTARWRNISIVAMSTAAALLIALFVVSRRSPDPLSSANPADVALISNEDVAAKRRLLAEMERVFGDRTVWIAESVDHETNDDVQVGFVDRASLGLMASRRLMIRVAVVRRNTEDEPWQTFRLIDVVSADEQFVQWSPQSGAMQMSVWAYVLPDGMVAVDTQIDLEGVMLRADSSSLQQSGVPAKVFSTRQGDVEFEVYQTVQFLDDNVG